MRNRDLVSHRQMTPQQKRMAEAAGILFPSPFPIFNSPPNAQAMQEWVENHKTPAMKSIAPKLGDIAQKIVDHVTYISFDTFLEQLRAAVKMFNETVQRPYVLWIGQKLANRNGTCSDEWVAGLALEHGDLRWPEAILHTDELRSYLKNNPDIQDVLLLDDACYSATHIQQQLSAVNMGKSIFNEHCKLTIGIPFMTEYGRKVISSPGVTVLPSVRLPQLEEILSKEEKDVLFRLEVRSMGDKTTTYFQHRLPDIFSTMMAISTGSHLLSGFGICPTMKKLGYTYDSEQSKLKFLEADEWNRMVAELIPNGRPFMPAIISPYRMNERHTIDQLREALLEHNVGERSSYPIPSRFSTVRSLLKMAGITVDYDESVTRAANAQFFQPNTDALSSSSSVPRVNR